MMKQSSVKRSVSWSAVQAVMQWSQREKKKLIFNLHYLGYHLCYFERGKSQFALDGTLLEISSAARVENQVQVQKVPSPSARCSQF